jgi:hypothetical protein
MLYTTKRLHIALLVVTIAGWAIFGSKLLIAAGIAPGTITSTWTGLARRHAWAHWVSTNGTPPIRDGEAKMLPGEQFEFAVQPIATCTYLRILTRPAGRFTILSKERPEAMATDLRFTTQQLVRAADGYHFFIAVDREQSLHSLIFTCRP